MGLFNKRAAAADPNTGAATGTHTHEKKPGLFSKRQHGAGATHHNGTPAWNTRPTFGQWIKATALDIVTMAAMVSNDVEALHYQQSLTSEQGAIGLGVYMARPAPSRSFPGK